MNKKIWDYAFMVRYYRDELRKMASAPGEVPSEFYTVQDKLMKTIKNAKAFCKRNGLDIKEWEWAF